MRIVLVWFGGVRKQGGGAMQEELGAAAGEQRLLFLFVCLFICLFLIIIGAHRLGLVWFGGMRKLSVICRSSVQQVSSCGWIQLQLSRQARTAAQPGPGPPTGAASARKQRPNNRGRGFFSYCSTTPGSAAQPATQRSRPNTTTTTN